jgi:hypothetical protein
MFQRGDNMMKHLASILSILLIVSPLQAREAKAKGGTADINIGVGELQETGINRQGRGGTKLTEGGSSDSIKDNSNGTPRALPEPKLDRRTYRE